MPVSYTHVDTTKGVEKSKFSLSLNRQNVLLRDENRKLNEESKENKSLNKAPVNALRITDPARKPVKRPLRSTYFNTLNAAKKLKTAQRNSSVTEDRDSPELVITSNKRGSILSTPAMLNGHHQPELGQYGGINRKQPIATLSNLGNTCFLNSVLYTLRFAPRFLHNLHHLVSDLSAVEQKLGSIRLKSSSLGRSAAGLASSGTRSWSSKDLLSLGQSDSSTGKSKIQIATERLHETYASLRAAESRCLASSAADATPEPYAADAFLSALREVNSIFEGNRQQDAHELLVCILDNIRETCRALSTRAARLQLHENGESNGIGRQPSLEGDSVKPSLGHLRKSWKKRKEGRVPERRDSPTEERAPSPSPPPTEQEERARPGWDFVADDFEGTTVLRTTCLECETVTERKQAMCDICVPVAEDGETAPEDEGEPFRAACVSSECLRDQNKYWCERCLRYNEARRSVAYERLPRLLVLQLKRFSGGMEKITRHAPTPLEMPCFCEGCVRSEVRPHRYYLWAVIMHLGQTLSGGHYVAYARDGFTDGKCDRDGETGVTASSGGFMRALFNRPRPVPPGCSARECCGPRSRPDAGWLACDDELVKPISKEEFDDLLSAEPKIRSAATPYLLFYAKTDVG